MEPRSDPPPAPKVAIEATKTCCGPSEPFAAPADAEEQLASFCKALGHPHRVHILRFLASQQACFAGEIANQLPVAASTVSQHLSLLKDSGLIRGEVDGPRRNYCIDPNALELLKRLVAAL